jgi:uncharacterized protein DUF4175
MDSFRAIRAQLQLFRGLLWRRQAARVAAYALAGLLVVAYVGPVAAVAASDRAVLPLRWVLLALALLGVAAIVAGVILPRRRLRRDGDVARVVGVAAPKLASDLLSAVELEAELERAPRFSADLAIALAKDAHQRLELVDPERVAPPGAARRAGVVLLVAAAGYVAGALLAPAILRAGWARLANPPRIAELALRAAPVSEPLVGDIRLVLTYPPYTRRPPLVVPAASGDLVAPRGTRIALETLALRPAAAAHMAFDNPAEDMPLAIEGRTLRGQLQVDKPRQFRFVLTPPKGGRPLVEANAHRIDVEPDRAPRVELIAPADELDVSARRRVELAYNIDDDYGIGEIALVWKGNGKEERKLLAPPAPGARSAQQKFYWDLNEITMGPGTRIAYHLEAKDNDDVGGPNVGQSKTFYLRIFSPRERHDQVVAREQEVFEEAVAALGTRLEAAAEDVEAHRAGHEEVERLLADVAGLLTLLAVDPMAPKGLKPELEGMHARLEKLVLDEQVLVADIAARLQHGGAVPKGAFAEPDRRMAPELERDVLELEDWIARQRLEDLLAISDELKQHRDKLKDLMEQYKRSSSPELRAEIEREIKAIEQRIAELQAKASQLGGEVADRFMNADAMDADSAQDCFQKVRELLDAGDVAGANKQLERCSRLADEQAQALENGLRGLRGDRFSEEEKTLGELMGEIADLEREQRSVAKDADELLDRYKERAAKAARDKASPQVEKARKTLEKLKKEVNDVPRNGLTPFSQEEMDALKQRLDDVGKMLNEGDIPEALAMAKHAEEGLKTIGADIEDDVSDGHPWSNRTLEAGDRVGRAEPVAKQLIDELQKATPSPQEMMEPSDRQRMSDLKRKERELRDRAQKLAQKAQKQGKELPGASGEMAEKGLGEAGEQMGRAEERMDAPDPMGAREESQGAADKLSELQDKMKRSARKQQMVGREDGRGLDDEVVKIPGSEAYKPSEAFREDILDAMKKEKPPDAFKDQVKRYYEELVK